jgi:hypothetical protein
MISGFRPDEDCALLGNYSLRNVPEERSPQYSGSSRVHETDHKRLLKEDLKKRVS